MLYEIKPSNIHGLGVFATHTIPPGTTILSEPPLLWSTPTGFLSAYQGLPASSLTKFHTLSNKDSDTTSRTIAEGIWGTNRFITPSGSGVFEHGSRINHSCVPNAAAVWRGGGKFEVVALRYINCGEEILQSYVHFGPEWGVKARRRRLMGGWEFECQCVLCVVESAELKSRRGWKWRWDL